MAHDAIFFLERHLLGINAIKISFCEYVDYLLTDFHKLFVLALSD